MLVYDKNDFFVKTYGTAGDWKPVDAVAYEDKLYVADAKNGEIKVFSLETGEEGSCKNSENWASPLTCIPTNIVFDNEGFLYVSDTAGSKSSSSAPGRQRQRHYWTAWKPVAGSFPPGPGP